MRKPQATAPLLRKPRLRKFTDGSDRFAIFNKARDNSRFREASDIARRRRSGKRQ
jgi:hypothetical protein